MIIGKYVALKDKLSGDYLEKFQFVEHYGEIHMVDSESMAEKMMGLIELMIQAQERGESVESVVGENVEDYCKNFYSDITVAHMLKDVVSLVRRWCWIVFVLELIFILSDMGTENFNLFTYRTDIGGYVVGIAIACFGVMVANIVGIIMTKYGKYSMKIWLWVAIISTILSVVVGFKIFLGNDSSFEILGWPLVVLSGLFLLVYYVVMFVNRYKKTGSMKKQENTYTTSFSKMIKEEITNTDYSRDASVVKAFTKRYKRKNKRRIKRGKAPLTTEEFFLKDEKYGTWGTFFGFCTGVLLVIVPTIYSEITCSGSVFESVMDMVIFLLIIGVITFFVIRLKRGFDKVVSSERKSILTECQARGVELDQYYEILLKENDESAQ